MSIQALGYVGIDLPDVDLWRGLATEVFGFAALDAPVGLYLRTDTRHHRISLSRSDNVGIGYIGWEVADKAALDEMAARFAAAGVVAEAVPADIVAERRMTEAIAVVDPAGFRHEVAYGPQGTSQFVPGNDTAGFIGEEEGLGHVLIVVPDLAAFRPFVIDVLGFTTYYDSTYRGVNVLFTRCNARTHCLAIFEVPGMRGLDHIFVEARNLRDVGIAYDRAQERDMEMAMTLGSHGLDPGVSFCAGSPSGFNVELGSDMIRVDGSEEPEMYQIWGHKRGDLPLGAAIQPAGDAQHVLS